jgi:hypothetical protein
MKAEIIVLGSGTSMGVPDPRLPLRGLHLARSAQPAHSAVDRHYLEGRRA